MTEYKDYEDYVNRYAVLSKRLSDANEQVQVVSGDLDEAEQFRDAIGKTGNAAEILEADRIVNQESEELTAAEKDRDKAEEALDTLEDDNPEHQERFEAESEPYIEPDTPAPDAAKTPDHNPSAGQADDTRGQSGQFLQSIRSDAVAAGLTAVMAGQGIAAQAVNAADIQGALRQDERAIVQTVELSAQGASQATVCPDPATVPQEEVQATPPVNEPGDAPAKEQAVDDAMENSAHAMEAGEEEINNENNREGAQLANEAYRDATPLVIDQKKSWEAPETPQRPDPPHPTGAAELPSAEVSASQLAASQPYNQRVEVSYGAPGPESQQATSPSLPPTEKSAQQIASSPQQSSGQREDDRNR